MKHLSFLATDTSSLRALDRYEGVALHILAYLLCNVAKDVYNEQVCTTTAKYTLHEAFPYVWNALLARLITDDVLHPAQHAVSTSE